MDLLGFSGKKRVTFTFNKCEFLLPIFMNDSNKKKKIIFMIADSQWLSYKSGMFLFACGGSFFVHCFCPLYRFRRKVKRYYSWVNSTSYQCSNYTVPHLYF